MKGVNKAAKPPATGTTGDINGQPAIPESNLPPRKTGPLSFEDLLGEFGEVTGKKEKQGLEKMAEANTARKQAEQTLDKTRKKVSRQMQQPEAKNFEAREQERREREAKEQSYKDKYAPSYETREGRVNYEDPEKASYEGLDDHKKRFAPFDEKVTASKSTNYARMLKDPQSARTAFVLGEIFKRKY
jgi:hypothetical protein